MAIFLLAILFQIGLEVSLMEKITTGYMTQKSKTRYLHYVDVIVHIVQILVPSYAPFSSVADVRSPREDFFTQLPSQSKVTSIIKSNPTSDFQTAVVVSIYAGAQVYKGIQPQSCSHLSQRIPLCQYPQLFIKATLSCSHLLLDKYSALPQRVQRGMILL